MPPSEPQTCVTLWVGGDLGPVSSACLASFVRHGHRVVLYCYDPPRDAPAGVELADAASVIPSSRIFRHKESGSYALFANLFRYELLRRSCGLWIDCDVYCVRPITSDKPNIFGWQRPHSINNAVLKLPADSPILPKLMALFTAESPVPPWLAATRQAEFRARRLAGERFGIADLPWGSAGPNALTYLLLEAGLAHHASPRSVFYPVAFEQGPLLLKAGANIRPLISPKTLTVHLWNQVLSQHVSRMEPGSAIDRLITEGTLFDEKPLGKDKAG